MTREEIDHIAFPGKCDSHEVIETHISWVVLCDEYVYKIKKPVAFSFLDFSTMEKRKYFCERELDLNRRLTNDLYLEVLPIWKRDNDLAVSSGKGSIIDYTVCMRKLNPDKRMDLLLKQDLVFREDITNLAMQLAHFHERTQVIPKNESLDIRKEFNALADVAEFMEGQAGKSAGDAIKQAIKFSNTFLEQHSDLFESRSPFYRDCHGDFHCQNIFLTPRPVIFDCIEFNDQLRYTDVLNEVAFLCMDLDAFGRHDLSEQFVDDYNRHVKAIRSKEEKTLFKYYKSYRANIRGKVAALKAMNAEGEERKQALDEAAKYLKLMNAYLSVVL